MRGTRSTVLTLVAVALLFGFCSDISAQGYFEEVFYGDLQVPAGIAPLDNNAWSLPVPIWVEKDEVLHLHMWGDFYNHPVAGKQPTGPAASIMYYTPGMTVADFFKQRRNALGVNYKLYVAGNAQQNIVEQSGAEFKATKAGVVLVSLADLSQFGGFMTLRIERFVPVDFEVELVWP